MGHVLYCRAQLISVPFVFVTSLCSFLPARGKRTQGGSWNTKGSREFFPEDKLSGPRAANVIRLEIWFSNYDDTQAASY